MTNEGVDFLWLKLKLKMFLRVNYYLVNPICE